ncbi:MAG: enoyl-CoA hydratase/isomerase family protein [Actinomycetota bacterium]|nr:enoyl-CoA hydratase/isomerase family protein [Actinomycetota bacterium]
MSHPGTDFATLTYEERDGVAWVTLNRPEVHNAFNLSMQRELHHVWTSLRHHDDVRVVVLTGAGDEAFCTGIDRHETLPPKGAPGRGGGGEDAGGGGEPRLRLGTGSTPFTFDDPGRRIGPKSCDLWKPVIAAVNGMACGGAFYMLGEVEFIIAADHATFFDPHVTYGMTAAFEPLHMAGRMPFGEIMRLSLLGGHERISARRACEIGLVSEVVARDQLAQSAAWAAGAIARQPPLAVQGTLRALWTAREMSRAQALSLAYAFVGLGTSADSIAAGQRAFASGARPDWRLR